MTEAPGVLLVWEGRELRRLLTEAMRNCFIRGRKEFGEGVLLAQKGRRIDGTKLSIDSYDSGVGGRIERVRCCVMIPNV